MQAADLQFLLDFDAWAMERVVATAERLSDAEFVAPAGPGHVSPRDTLVHCADAMQTWRQRLQGAEEAVPSAVEDALTLTDVRAFWRSAQESLATFVAGLAESDLNGVLEARRPDRYIRGERWQFVLHIVMHNMQHRSELARALTVLGHSPGELGMTEYLKHTLAAEQPAAE